MWCLGESARRIGGVAGGFRALAPEGDCHGAEKRQRALEALKKECDAKKEIQEAQEKIVQLREQISAANKKQVAAKEEFDALRNPLKRKEPTQSDGEPGLNELDAKRCKLDPIPTSTHSSSLSTSPHSPIDCSTLHVDSTASPNNLITKPANPEQSTGVSSKAPTANAVNGDKEIMVHASAQTQEGAPMMWVGYPISVLHQLSHKKELNMVQFDKRFAITNQSSIHRLSKNYLSQLSVFARKLGTDVHARESILYHSNSSTKLETNRKCLEKSRFIMVTMPFAKAKIKIQDDHYVSSNKGLIEAKFRYLLVSNRGDREEWGWGHEIFTFEGDGPVKKSEMERNGFVPLIAADKWRAWNGNEVPINVILVEGRHVADNSYIKLERTKFHWKSPIKKSEGYVPPESLIVLSELAETHAKSLPKDDFKVSLPKTYTDGLIAFMKKDAPCSEEFRKELYDFRCYSNHELE